MTPKQTTKQILARICLYSASALLASGIAIAQNPGMQQPTPGQQQPGAPNQPTNPNMGTNRNMGMEPPDNSMQSQQAIVDKDFVKKALEGGTAEVQLGQLAQQKSQSNDVKQFGQRMVADHTQLGDQMKPVAQQLGVKPPTEPAKKDRQLLAKLETLSGPQFDDAYIQAMLKDHQQDLKDFTNETHTAQNPNVKQVAQVGAGVISQHLQLIQQIAQNHNVTVAGKGK